MKCGFHKYMDLFVPLYVSFCVCLKRIVLVPSYGLRPQPKTDLTLNYFGPYHAYAMLFFRTSSRLIRACTVVFNVESLKVFKGVICKKNLRAVSP
jgi:hypothetical protein